jgi:hypothetical protein
MDENLADAVFMCTELSRETVLEGSQRWTWDRAWEIFRNNLIEAK